MSLITRCSTCGTMFKVVADQLKISQGWVRCGHCSEVFDAAANLQPFTPASSLPAAGVQDAALPQEAATMLATAAAGAEPLVVPGSSSVQTFETGSVSGQMLTVSVSIPEVQVSMPPDIAADVFVSSVSPEPPAFSAPPLPVTPARDDAARDSGFEPEAPEAGNVREVSFVREAMRDAFWRRPALRWSLALVSCALLATLLLQMALFQRSTLAMSQPWLRPGLQALCGYLRCEIAPPQQIEAVVIDSSSFNKLAANTYRLQVVIRNTGVIPLALPSLELTLTDSQDQAQLRRVLTPVELGATAPTLAAGAEFPGVVVIRILNPPPDANGSAAAAVPPSGPLRIAGYRVLAFYP